MFYLIFYRFNYLFCHLPKSLRLGLGMSSHCRLIINYRYFDLARCIKLKKTVVRWSTIIIKLPDVQPILWNKMFRTGNPKGGLVFMWRDWYHSLSISVSKFNARGRIYTTMYIDIHRYRGLAVSRDSIETVSLIHTICSWIVSVITDPVCTLTVKDAKN